MERSWKETGIDNRFIHELQHFCSQHDQIEAVLLFGSRARGDHDSASDIDLAIFTKNTSHTRQNVIENAIDEMTTPLKIDVVFIGRLAKVKMVSNIKKEGVVVYEQGKAFRKA